MKYYIGYFNKPWNESEFTVICATPHKAAAQFVLGRYQETESDKKQSTYVMLTAAEVMDKALIF